MIALADVVGDAALAARLRAHDRWDGFAEVLGVSADELGAARQAARRAWLERELPARARALDDVVPHGFTPIRFSAEGSTHVVEWCDLRGVAFSDPFFQDTVQRALLEPYRLLFRPRTAVAALQAVAARLGDAPPAGLVLHTSRCGSTLACRMLAALPGTPVISEPVPVDELLRAPGIEAAWVRWLLTALGAGGGVVKLDAWSVRERPLLRAALPGVPWVFLYRDAAEVIASHLRLPGMHMLPGGLPPELFGLDLATAVALAPEDYAARVLGSVCASALEHLDDDARLVAYRALPDAVVTEIAPHFGLTPGPAEAARMRAAAAVDAKRPGQPFDAGERPVSAAARAAAERWAAPAVAELERRRASWS